MSEANPQVEVQRPPAPAASPGSASAAAPASKPGLGSCWQIPALAIGLLMLGGGIARMALGHQPVTFENQIRNIRLLREAGALQRVNAYLLDLLRRPELTDPQRAELHRQLMGVIYQADRPLQVHTPENARAIINNFRKAAHYGLTPSAEDWLTAADAHAWLAEWLEATAAYRQALARSVSRPDHVRRLLLQAHLESGKPITAEEVPDLDGILEDPAAAPGNYLWALDRKTRWLLDEGDATSALALVQAGQTRLEGTADRLALRYYEALCRCGGGTRYSEEAETLLRSLLNEWPVRDDLWGDATWLLGRMQQIDERPQEALSYYDSILESFQTGDLTDASRLARAECLAALDRYQRAFEEFAGLKGRLLQTRQHTYLDRQAVRATVGGIGANLLFDGVLPLAIEYLRLALELTTADEEEARQQYRTQIALGLTKLGRRMLAEQTDAAQQAQGQDLLMEAADLYLALSQYQRQDEPSFSRSVEAAVGIFDRLGRTDDVVKVLSHFVVAHPSNERRAWGLQRLGEAYQALGQYRLAVEAYHEVITAHPRLLEAQASMVPMAECLLALGGAEAQQGVDLLVAIVDDGGPDLLFDPQAREYRQALFRLARYYLETDEPGHLEKAISRLEDALALYPDDPQGTRLTFQLADAYRRSAAVLRRIAAQAVEESERRRLHEQVEERTRKALDGFDRVIAALAGQDESALEELERVYLRTSYLNRGDALADLNQLTAAIEAYNEAVWRYEDRPEAVTASLQIVHCHQRLGQPAEAAAALERLKWMLQTIPASAFAEERGMSSKEYWQNTVARLQEAGFD